MKNKVEKISVTILTITTYMLLVFCVVALFISKKGIPSQSSTEPRPLSDRVEINCVIDGKVISRIIIAPEKEKDQKFFAEEVAVAMKACQPQGSTNDNN